MSCKHVHLTITDLTDDSDICQCGKKLNRILSNLQSKGAKKIQANCKDLKHIEIDCDVPLDKLENFS